MSQTLNIIETQDIERIQQLSALCYMDAYKEIHTVEQNRFSYGEMYSTESLQDQIFVQHSRFFILQDQGFDQGYAAILPYGKDEDGNSGIWMLDKLYLRPSCKGKGYGRCLEQYVEQFIKQLEQAPYKLILKVNRRNAAVEFYKHLGFVITGQWDHPIADGKWIMDGYDMEKRIE